MRLSSKLGVVVVVGALVAVGAPLWRTLTEEPNRISTMWMVTYKPVGGYVGMSWYLGGGDKPGKERILRSGAATSGSAYVGETIWATAAQDPTSTETVYDLEVKLYVRGRVVKTCNQAEAASICSWRVA
jgi:hypothetical protein